MKAAEFVELRAKNFPSLKEVRLKLGKLCVLVGPNASVRATS